MTQVCTTWYNCNLLFQVCCAPTGVFLAIFMVRGSIMPYQVYSCRLCLRYYTVGSKQELFFLFLVKTIEPPVKHIGLGPVTGVYLFICPETSHVKNKFRVELLFQVHPYFC